jgi:glutamate 2,3-aminomutase
MVLQFLFHIFTMIMSAFWPKHHLNRRPKAFLAAYQMVGTLTTTSYVSHNKVFPCPPRGDSLLFNTIRLEPNKAYFLYVGEIKAYGLNPFLIPVLEQIYGRPVDCIAIVPDVLASYPYSNLAVLNSTSYQYHCNKGLLVNCRPSPGEFANEVSSSFLVQELLERILREQDCVYIHMFASQPEMHLTDGEKVRLLGPDPALAHHFNNKIIQHQMACRLRIPVPEGFCCNCLEEALDSAQSFFRSGEEVFVSEAYSAAGSNSAFVCNCEEIQNRFVEREQPYLVTRRVPHRHDPTVLAVVANGEDVYVASVADQKMEENRFRGSTFPTELKKDVVERIKEYTRLVGRYMGAQGYRGIFGCDYIVDDSGQIYFVEVNARKQGTTLESTLTMLHRLPGHLSLPEIEFCAITQGKLPQSLIEMDSTESDLCWGTLNIKCQEDVLAIGDIPRLHNEAEAFRRVSESAEDLTCAIVEDYLGAGVHQRAGGFVGRCISVGKTLSGVQHALEERERAVKSSTLPWNANPDISASRRIAMKESAAKKESPPADPMEIPSEDREVALARSAEVKGLITDFLKARNKIPTGLKLEKEYTKAKKRILKVLGGTEKDWQQYKWHLKNRIEDVETLGKIIRLTHKEMREIRKTSERYRWGISPYYASLIDPTDKKCPVRLQAVPSIRERLDISEIKDPMIIKYNSPAPLISRLYPDRLIINVTNMCSMFCRHCLRRKDIGHDDLIYSRSKLRQALEYIRQNQEIRDVLLTGGDALSLSDAQLDWILTELDKIPHVEIKRLGSRMPCVLPQRITPALCRMLEKHDPVYLNTQYNHPKEITREAQRAVDRLTKAGVVVRDQTVLMKGINNDPHVMKVLMHEMLRIKVAPYYIFNCKKVEGIRHFRTSIQEGLNIMEQLRGYTSGMAVPTYIITAPEGRGKTPIAPQYLLNTNFNGDVLIRTWGGHVLQYEDEKTA